uniref:Uncharacterized protein n=1 Tax=Megaselia scalaris TaxID=36166 RepID=T1GN62_MEGSC
MKKKKDGKMKGKHTVNKGEDSLKNSLIHEEPSFRFRLFCSCLPKFTAFCLDVVLQLETPIALASRDITSLYPVPESIQIYGETFFCRVFFFLLLHNRSAIT